MKLFIKYLLLLFSIVFFSCEEVTDYELNPEQLNFIVVNGHLTNEKKAHEIVLNHPVNDLNDTPNPVSGAFVSIYDGDSLHELQEALINPGVYKTDENFRAVINRPYTLLIITSSSRYYSSTYMLPVSPFNRLKYRLDQEKNLYTIDSVNQAFDKNESAIYKVEIDWTGVLGFESIDESLKKATLYYYT